MTQEEKAKAYDEVREKIALRFGSNVAEEIFSEFEMSKDEKVKKALIDGFKRYDDGALFNGCLVREILPWLEKQGQKPFNYECANIPQKDFSPAIGIEIPFGAKDSELKEATYLIPEGFHAEIKDNEVIIKKGKRVSTWSEDDENRFNNLILLVKDSNENKATREGFIKFIDKLKSIRSQDIWKPSDEQLYILNWLATNVLGDGVVDKKASEILYTLYDDLKKL